MVQAPLKAAAEDQTDIVRLILDSVGGSKDKFFVISTG